MATHQDWLPGNHKELKEKAVKARTYLNVPENYNRMGFAVNSPQRVWLANTFDAVYNPYIAACLAWEDEAERTKNKTITFEEAEAAFKPVFREFYTGFLKSNPLVTDTDLNAMGLPTRHSGGHHPAPVATTYPDFDIDSSLIRHLTVHFYDQGSKSKAKPAGQHGAEIRWAILDAMPVDVSALTNSSFDTRTPFTLEFEGHQRGKTIYFSLRWENTRGEKGPWSEIQSAIIP
jgi:hypothetical protein